MEGWGSAGEAENRDLQRIGLFLELSGRWGKGLARFADGADPIRFFGSRSESIKIATIPLSQNPENKRKSFGDEPA